MASHAPFLNPYRRRIAVDVAIAGVVLWFTGAQFGSQGFGDLEDVATDPDGLGLALVLLASLPLVWRRRAPRLVFGLTIAASLALVSLGYAVHAPLGPAVGLYTLASRPDRGPIWPPIAVATISYAALVAIEIAVLELNAERYVVAGLLWAAAWPIGDRQRTARLREAEAAERRDREQRLALAEERTRIARDLHDSAGHAISNILVQAGAARVLLERDPERSREALAAVEQVARETLVDVERIVGLLREEQNAELAPLPGIDEIAELVETHRNAGLDFRLRLDGDARTAVPREVDRAAYRIAQEALTNAARHGTGSAEVVVSRSPDALELTVTNPFAPSRPTGQAGSSSERGILGMRERAALLGGTLEAGPEGGGWRLRAVLPYARERA
jgi:signal transduction histidine kinase